MVSSETIWLPVFYTIFFSSVQFISYLHSYITIIETNIILDQGGKPTLKFIFNGNLILLFRQKNEEELRRSERALGLKSQVAFQ